MKKITTAATILALGAGSLLAAAPATAAPAVAPTAVVQVQAGHNKDRDAWIFGLKKPRVYICQIAPALCKGR